MMIFFNGVTPLSRVYCQNKCVTLIFDQTSNTETRSGQHSSPHEVFYQVELLKKNNHHASHIAYRYFLKTIVSMVSILCTIKQATFHLTSFSNIMMASPWGERSKARIKCLVYWYVGHSKKMLLFDGEN